MIALGRSPDKPGKALLHLLVPVIRRRRTGPTREGQYQRGPGERVGDDLDRQAEDLLDHPDRRRHDPRWPESSVLRAERRGPWGVVSVV